jgi:hypothetical protein
VDGRQNYEENRVRNNAFIGCGLQAEESSVIFYTNGIAKIILAPSFKKNRGFQPSKLIIGLLCRPLLGSYNKTDMQKEKI